MSDCSQNQDSDQISPVSLEKRGRKKDLVLHCVAELGCSQAPQMEYDCKFKLNLFNELNPQGQTGRL